MNTYYSFLFVLILFSACKAKHETDASPNTGPVPVLKKYQQYALDRIIVADSDDQGFSLTDSFFLWSLDDFGMELRQNRITRTFDRGFFYYTFWIHKPDTSFIYAEEEIPGYDWIKDTMIDNNADGFKDLVVFNKFHGNKPLVYQADTTVRRFRKVRDSE